MDHASDAVRLLLIKKKRDDRGASTMDTSVVFAPPPVEKKRRPEDSVPDIPQNAAVRDFLRKAGGPGAVPLGKEMTLSQCWRCKVYGHATGSRECPYFESGNIELEAERRVREDPMARSVRNVVTTPSEMPAAQKQQKLAALQELLDTVTKAESERKRLKKDRKKDKKHHKKNKKKNKKDEETRNNDID